MLTKSPIPEWRKYNQNYFLQGNICTTCKKIYYPKVYLCKCGSQQFKTIKLDGIGTLLSFTQITIPPQAFSNQIPYCIGIIELKQGPKIITQIADVKLNDLKIGMKMKSCFRKIYSQETNGIISYGIKFKPI